MKKALLSVVVFLMLAGAAYGIPLRTAEMGAVPMREFSPAAEVCILSYYNLCSGWVFYWTGYCNGLFEENLPVQYGTCFDLEDCPDDCRDLVDMWWALKRYTVYGLVDIEIYCADDHHCPVGPPLAGIYGYVPDIATAWQHFVWDFPCFECLWEKYVVLITDWTAGIHTSPYSDHVPLNVEAGCQDWRCVGHSYVYKNVIDYCPWYGSPGPMWVSGPNYGCGNYPPIPPGCHNYTYPTGTYTEFILDCYIYCLGATATEEDSWSEVKALYR